MKQYSFMFSLCMVCLTNKQIAGAEALPSSSATKVLIQSSNVPRLEGIMRKKIARMKAFIDNEHRIFDEKKPAFQNLEACSNPDSLSLHRFAVLRSSFTQGYKQIFTIQSFLENHLNEQASASRINQMIRLSITIPLSLLEEVATPEELAELVQKNALESETDDTSDEASYNSDDYREWQSDKEEQDHKRPRPESAESITDTSGNAVSIIGE